MGPRVLWALQDINPFCLLPEPGRSTGWGSTSFALVRVGAGDGPNNRIVNALLVEMAWSGKKIS